MKNLRSPKRTSQLDSSKTNQGKDNSTVSLEGIIPALTS